MKVFRYIQPLQAELSHQRDMQKSIGFVATMGALHEGHMALVDEARKNNDLVVVSIFVNPIQFNNPEDLEKYPRTLTDDINTLEKRGCDIVFTPSDSEMYPEPVRENYNFGNLDKVMEGKYRPGHFNGVAIVVRKLLEIVRPHQAFFGEKDYQQLTIIRKLVEQSGLNIEIVGVPIMREKDGLAMSSRNARLKPEERQAAPEIYRILKKSREKWSDFSRPGELKHWGLEKLNQHKLIEPEYFEIVDMDTLEEIEQWNDTSRCIVCLAVYIGKVRLIDNIILFS